MEVITTVKIEEHQNSLSEIEKDQIKQAVLASAAQNTRFPPHILAEYLCRAILLIDSYEHQ